MSKKVDWKARCAEHCGTIGKRDATITELEARLEQLENESLYMVLARRLAPSGSKRRTLLKSLLPSRS